MHFLPLRYNHDSTLRINRKKGQYLKGAMNLLRLGLICSLLTASVFGQLTVRNPVDELKDQFTQALEEARLPLTDDQERQLALLVEDERQAAENLFGETWDFSQGPPQGEQQDQALAGIRWMYDAMRNKLECVPILVGN